MTMRKVLWAFFGMFMGSDGVLSSSKIISLAGYSAFLLVSVIILIKAPERFDYELFAILTAGSGAGLRVFDKYLNIKGRKA